MPLVQDLHLSKPGKTLYSQLKWSERASAMLRKQIPTSYFTGERDERPWGSWRVIDTGKQHTVKLIEVHPGQRFSLQIHNHRSEHWLVVEGCGEVTLGGDLIKVEQGRHIFIPSDTKHRIHNTGTGPLVFVEVQFGRFLDEDDVVRLEDDYGRLK